MPEIVTVIVGDTPEDANWILSPARRAEEIAILKAVAAERRVKAMAGAEVSGGAQGAGSATTETGATASR